MVQRGTRSGRRVTRRRLRTVVGVIIVCVYLFPVYWMVATSLKFEADTTSSPPNIIPMPATLAPYTQALSNPTIWHGLLSSTIIAVGTAAVAVAFATPAAYGLARTRIKFVGPALILFLIVQMVPSINLVLPLFSIFNRLHLNNTYQGLIIANSAFAVPLAVTIMRPYFLSVPGELVEAALVDGSNAFTAFVRVVLPLVRPAIVTVAAVSFVGAWGEYVFALSLNNSPARQPVTIVLAELTQDLDTNWNYIMAVSVLVAIPVVVLFIVLQREIVAGLAEGSTK